MRGPRIIGAKYRVRNLLREHGFEVIRVVPPSRTPVFAESLLALHLHWLFAAARVDTVLDVGAHLGEYGLWLRHNGFAGRIVSFEPVRASFEELVCLSAGDDAWDAVNIALGSEDGTAEINVTRHTDFSSFLLPNEDALQEHERRPEVDHVELVPVRRLDGVLNELLPNWRSQRLYLKMDTQGWDLQVLAGATDVLSSTVALQSEVSVRPIYCGMPHFDESIRELEKCGFSLSGLFPVGRDSRFRVIEFDCVCVADGVLAAGC